MKKAYLVFFLPLILLINQCKAPNGPEPIEEEEPISEEPLEVPGNPYNLSASEDLFLDKIVLSWEMDSVATSYEIHRSETEEGEFLKVGSSDSLGFEDYTVSEPEVPYYYKVRAVSSDSVLSEFSEIATGSLYRFKLSWYFEVRQIDTKSSLHIGWIRSRYADHYELYRSIGDSLNFELISTQEEYIFEDEGLTPVVDHYYKMRAWNEKVGYTEFTKAIKSYPYEEYQMTKMMIRPGSEEGQLHNPYGISFDEENNFYVSESGGAYRVQKFDENGVSKGIVAEGYTPKGIHLTKDNSIIVAFSGEGVKEFSAAGKQLKAWSRDTFNSREIDLDASGNLYVADITNNMVRKFDKNRNLIKSWGPVVGALELQGLSGLEVIGEQIVVSDKSGIWFFDKTGVFQSRLNNIDWVVYITEYDGFLYLSKRFEVIKMDYSGKIYARIKVNGMLNPTGTAFDEQGKLFVMDDESENYSVKVFEKRIN